MRAREASAAYASRLRWWRRYVSSSDRVAAIAYGEASPREKILADALAYYADPMTYFGIAMFGDPPHGDFFEDFDKYPFPGDYSIQDKPGRRAREALATVFVPGEGVDNDDA